MLMRLLGSGLAGGVAGGLLVALVQLLAATPLILQAEAFEHGAAASAVGPADAGRVALTVTATVAIATGYAWLLLAAMRVRGATITARAAVPWAVAGFFATGLAPAFGMPPELPGSASADILARQLWWVGTAAATALGLAVIAFGRSGLWVAAGVVLIVLPHIIGAPQAAASASRVPAELAAHFVAVSLTIQALIWVLPGAVAGHVLARMEA